MLERIKELLEMNLDEKKAIELRNLYKELTGVYIDGCMCTSSSRTRLKNKVNFYLKNKI